MTTSGDIATTPSRLTLKRGKIKPKIIKYKQTKTLTLKKLSKN
ncbi:hypothetical protein [Campylobacter phage CJLB-7]|nr:hypothetical protein [Campylobacter phage CJLB-7]